MATAGTTMPATASITRTDGPDVKRNPLGWLVPLAAGLVIVALAAPRLYAYTLLALEAPGVTNALRTGHALAPTDLSSAREHYGEALAVLPGDDGIARDLGRLDLRASVNAGDEPMMSALAHIRQAAGDAPNSAFNWTLLAYATQLGGGEREDFLRYLRLSTLTGPYEASSMLLRAKMTLPLWQDLPEETRRDATRDIRRMWSDRRFRDRMMTFYLSRNYRERAVILAVGFEDDRERALFERLLLRKLKLPRR